MLWQIVDILKANEPRKRYRVKYFNNEKYSDVAQSALYDFEQSYSKHITKELGASPRD